MDNEFSRTKMLFGQSGMESLYQSKIAVFGIGGVGGYVVEALARSGVGELHIIDNDTVSLSNINRQIIALHSTVGRAKVDVMKERIMDINPNCRVKAINCFVDLETINDFDFSSYDYVVDAIDSVTGKIALAAEAQKFGVKIISSMGTGNKLDPTSFEVSDIYSTSVCPLARVMRRELKKRNVKALKVVYSKEEPVSVDKPSNELGKRIPASNSFVPSVAGLIIAGEVIKDIVDNK